MAARIAAGSLMTSRGRQYPDGPLEAPPGSIWGRLPADSAWTEAAGEFMHRMLNPEPEPGPPYVHTLVLAEPEYDEDDGSAD